MKWERDGKAERATDPVGVKRESVIQSRSNKRRKVFSFNAFHREHLGITLRKTRQDFSISWPFLSVYHFANVLGVGPVNRRML